jgi:hypothetical protein
VSAAVEGAEDGETTRLWRICGETGDVDRFLGWVGERGGPGGCVVVATLFFRRRRCSSVVDSEAARLRAVWGELGNWDVLGGCSDASGSVCRRSRGVACGTEWGRAGGFIVVDDNVAVVHGGSRYGTGVWGSSWGELDGVGGLLDRLLGRWGLQGSSVEQTTRSDERVSS